MKRNSKFIFSAQILYGLSLWLLLPMLLVFWGCIYHFSNELSFEVGVIVAFVICLQILGLYFKYRISFYLNYIFLFVCFIIATFVKQYLMKNLVGDAWEGGMIGGLYGLFIVSLFFWHRTYVYFIGNRPDNTDNSVLTNIVSGNNNFVVTKKLILVFLGVGGVMFSLMYYWRDTEPFNQCVQEVENEIDKRYKSDLEYYQFLCGIETSEQPSKANTQSILQGSTQTGCKYNIRKPSLPNSKLQAIHYCQKLMK